MEEERFVKIMAELTLVSARMEALVQTCLIVKKTAEREISCLVLVKMVKSGINLRNLEEDHVKKTVE